jgi:hypothetical protein
MWEDNAIANDFITAIINNFNDDDEDVRAASVQALCELAKYSKKAPPFSSCYDMRKLTEQ